MSSFAINFSERARRARYVNLFLESGRVTKVVGPIIEGTLIGASVGGTCFIQRQGLEPLEAEIVGFRNKVALLMPVDAAEGISMGARIELGPSDVTVPVGDHLLGQLLDGRGFPFGSSRAEQIDWAHRCGESRKMRGRALLPIERASIVRSLVTGVRVLDVSVPFGLGQRLAIMAGSGVGKSVLMGMIARYSTADINVIALIGERGREVTEFIEKDLGPDGMKKSVVIAVTGDQSPVARVRGAHTATSIAEYFRDQGKNVLLMMDSITRFSMALREIGLSSGEPPTTKGYTPSVFSEMPRLLERAGAKKGGGSITGLYTVLVEGDDMDDPIADAVRSIVDGHIVLSRELAHRNHYPAVDVLASISRLSSVIMDKKSLELSHQLREVLATYKSAEDIINIGGYKKGVNAGWDRAVELYPKLQKFLKQDIEEYTNFETTQNLLGAILRG